MKRTTTRAMLVIVAVLLAVDLAVRMATPATAQPPSNGARPWCVSLTDGYVPSNEPGASPFTFGVLRAWSDGTVEYQRTVGSAGNVFTGWQPFPN